ncbi:MAG: energy transducer TonB [Nitrospirales bacterium]
MTAALPVQPELSTRTLVICGILSIGLHAGLLAGFNIIERSTPPIETVELINVTLVPTNVPTDISSETAESSEIPTPVTPPMRTSTRSLPQTPISQPTTPMVSLTRPIMPNSALAITPAVPVMETPPPPHKKRMLRDTRAADALFAQQATKMVKRSTSARAAPITMSDALSMDIKNVPSKQSLSQTMTSINTAPATSRPTRSRRLTTQPSSTSEAGIVKIGVRHSIQPIYPRVAKEEGWEGIVLLQVLVRTSGVPGDITVRKSSGHQILDNAAIEAMRQWRFAPAMDGNFPVEKYLQVPLKFGLHR